MSVVYGKGVGTDRKCPYCDHALRKHNRAPHQPDDPDIVNYFYKCHNCGEVRIKPVDTSEFYQG